MREIRQAIVSLGGVSNISDILEVAADGTAVDPNPPPPLLDLYCTFKPRGIPCGAVWKSEAFTPCPMCGKKQYVHKGKKAA